VNKTKTKRTENPSVNQINYTGTVTIKVVKNGKIIKKNKGKNAGLSPLFSFLTNCLVGNFVPKLSPKFIQLYNSADELITLAEIPFSEVNVYEGSSSEESSIAAFKFLVPYASVTSGETIYRVNIKNDVEDMAELILPEGDQISLESGENVIVEWEMEISNRTE
jgi:hypothetical protein